MENQIAKVQDLVSFEVIKGENGKFHRRAVYNPFSSIQAETREQKIEMMNLLEGDSDKALAMNEHVDMEFTFQDVIMKPYDSVDEETGEITYGVLSYLFDTDGNVFVTSSKSVYHTLKNLFEVFGLPHYNEDEAVKVKIVKKQGERHKYVDLKVIG